MATSPESIAALQRDVWEASNRRNLKLLETLLDDDFVLVEADTLERKNKQDFLRDVSERDEEEALVSFELSHVKVQVAGDMAIAYAQFHCEDEVDGERLGMSGNAVDIFVNRAGTWKLAGSVYGEVPPFSE